MSDAAHDRINELQEALTTARAELAECQDQRERLQEDIKQLREAGLSLPPAEPRAEEEPKRRGGRKRRG